ncbi:MAG: polyprenyl synthetase family protein [Armatimonadota bacterium]
MSTPKPPSNHSPFACIEKDLQAVETILDAQARSETHVASQVCRHVHRAGGKRLRPVLLLLTARALGCQDDSALWAAAAVEMVHAATLLHDDVVDGAAKRRGVETAASIWGPTAAIMSGDILLARSLAILMEHKLLDMLRRLANTATTMCRAELIQSLHRGNLNVDLDTYLDVITGKTADFLSACCESGAMVAGRSDMRPRAARYGLNLGIAFQITDDLLDYFGDPSVTGKPVGGDLRERKPTIPLILALQSASPEDAEKLKMLASIGPELTSAQFTEAQAILTRLHVPQQVRSLAGHYAEAAVQEVSAFPDNPHTHALVAVAVDLAHRRA